MKGYLGEVVVTDQHDISPNEMALLFIYMYGGIDGAHHKDWVLDQVARILNGAPVIIKEARWANGHTELRYEVGTCESYERWIAKINEEDSYKDGIAP